MALSAEDVKQLLDATRNEMMLKMDEALKCQMETFRKLFEGLSSKVDGPTDQVKELSQREGDNPCETKSKKTEDEEKECLDDKKTETKTESQDQPLAEAKSETSSDPEMKYDPSNATKQLKSLTIFPKTGSKDYDKKGIFAVYWIRYTKESNVTQSVLKDGNNDFAWFTAFNEKAKEWSTIVKDSVIEVNNFKWETQTDKQTKKMVDQKKFHPAVTIGDFKGCTCDKTTFKILPEETAELMIIAKDSQLSTLSYVQKHNNRFVALLVEKSVKSNLQKATFLTSDNQNVDVIFFETEKNKLEQLEPRKTYRVENTKHYESDNCWAAEAFTCTKQSSFTVVNKTFSNAGVTSQRSISLKELLGKTDIRETDIFRINAYAMSTANDSLVLITDETTNGNFTLLAVVCYQGQIPISRSEEIVFDFRVTKKDDHYELNVVDGSLVFTKQKKQIISDKIMII